MKLIETVETQPQDTGAMTVAESDEVTIEEVTAEWDAVEETVVVEPEESTVDFLNTKDEDVIF